MDRCLSRRGGEESRFKEEEARSEASEMSWVQVVVLPTVGVPVEERICVSLEEVG